MINAQEFKDTVCRICLDENSSLNWNSTLDKQSNVTYKDCYLKYTQLKCLDDDPFSSMLCKICSEGLLNMHNLILTALDSYNFLMEVNSNSTLVNDTIIHEEDANYGTEFETILVEKYDIDSDLQEHFEYEYANEESYKKIAVKDKLIKEEKDTVNITIEPHNEDWDIDEGDKKDRQNINSDRNIKHDFKSRSESDPQEEEFKIIPNDDVMQKNQEVKKKSLINTPCMCSYCSKILRNKYSLKNHEKTHLEKRERTAICPICGTKFFDKIDVKNHMRIHDKNREKKHKCEFCDKAFYEKGALNIHRRVHLGLMTPCTLCSKEFYRKVDLEIHMNSHSASQINSNTRKTSRYWVRCKYCDKVIRSTTFKSHTAAHLNEPLMKCSLCNKEYFTRESCTQHLKNHHQKSSEEYNEFIILYKKNRLSHLYLSQTAELKADSES